MPVKPAYSRIVTEKGNPKFVLDGLFYHSQSFDALPLPDGEWMFTVKGENQGLLDKLVEGQLGVEAHTGHCSDGGGIQRHSAGELYPWICVVEEDLVKKWGKVYYQHPDGRKTSGSRYTIPGCRAAAEGEAERELRQLIVDQTIAESAESKTMDGLENVLFRLAEAYEEVSPLEESEARGGPEDGRWNWWGEG